MASLRISDSPVDADTAWRLRKALAQDHRVELPVHAFGGNLWLRISTQIYNEFEDYRRCADAFRAVAKSMNLLD
jgi:hypothetical protein